MRYIILLFLALNISYSQEIVGYQQDDFKKVDSHTTYPSDFTYYPDLNLMSEAMNGSNATLLLGSPFFENTFKPGQVRINDQLAFNVLLRYNANREVIEYAIDDKRYDLSRREFITAEFGDKTFQIMPFYEDGEIKKSYFFLVSGRGEAELYYRPKKEVRKEIIRPGSSGRPNGIATVEPAICKDVSSYYLKIGKNPARKVNLNEEEVLATLGFRASNLIPIIESHDLNLKKEKDVVWMLDFYNREIAKPRKGKIPEQIAAIRH